MHITCPHCSNPINLVLEPSSESVTCPQCGSNFALFDPELTTVHREQQIRRMGRFDLKERLGSGRFGDVWLAYDTTLEREVAVKVPRRDEVPPDEIAMFLREARSAANLRHPNIVQVLEVGRSANLIFIVSQVVHGSNLRDWLSANSVSYDRAAELCVILARALHHAHERGIVHRDLKPANILIDATGVPHLTDFGLAKRDAPEITITIDGHVLGTPAYMAPEQARGESHKADGRSDVYSLGVVLYEMLTNQRPFRGSSRLTLIQQVLSEDPPPPRKIKSDIPRDLETICLKALAKDPDDRYQSAHDMAADLQRFLERRPIVARRTPHYKRAWMWTKRNPVIASLGGLAVLLACLVAGLIAARPTELRRTVEITTDPVGAEIYFFRIDPEVGLPDPHSRVDGGPSPATVKLVPGNYLVVADHGAQGFHEVHRRVPDEKDFPSQYRHHSWKEDPDTGHFVLEPIEIFPVDYAETQQMAFFEGTDSFVMGSPQMGDALPHERSVPSFYLDTSELNVGTFATTADGTPRTFPDGLSRSMFSDDQPIPRLTYDRAVEVAESLGKRLQDETEYEFAATRKGQVAYPWGNSLAPVMPWSYSVADAPFDRVPSDNGRDVIGLYSGLVEWTANEFAPYPSFPYPEAVRPLIDGHNAITRGGPHEAATRQTTVPWNVCLGSRQRIGEYKTEPFDGLGCRLARSARPRILPEHFIQIRSEPRPNPAE